MDTKRISAVSGTVLFALTATASAGPMSFTSSKHIALPQTQTEPVYYRYYGGYGGWNRGAAIAGAAIGLLTLGAVAATAGSPYYGYGYPSYGWGYGYPSYGWGYGYPTYGSYAYYGRPYGYYGGLIATATRIIEITVTTTTQDIVITAITGTKTIAIMATGRAGTMCTKAASIRDAALDMATCVTGGASVKPAARARAGA
jgi:hypothetical protein